MIGWDNDTIARWGYDLTASLEQSGLDIRDPDLLTKMVAAQSENPKIATFLAKLSDDRLMRGHQFKLASGLPLQEAVAEKGPWSPTQ